MCFKWLADRITNPPLSINELRPEKKKRVHQFWPSFDSTARFSSVLQGFVGLNLAFTSFFFKFFFDRRWIESGQKIWKGRLGKKREREGKRSGRENREPSTSWVVLLSTSSGSDGLDSLNSFKTSYFSIYSFIFSLFTWIQHTKTFIGFSCRARNCTVHLFNWFKTL